jgi:hypothetical protein
MMLSLLENLRESNRRLSLVLDGIAVPNTQPRVASPEQMAALLSELLRVGASLRSEPPVTRGNDPELDAELGRYRGHVERLRDLLPSLHSQLLQERARLESQRARIGSAVRWVHASRQTL